VIFRFSDFFVDWGFFWGVRRYESCGNGALALPGVSQSDYSVSRKLSALGELERLCDRLEIFNSAIGWV
jgi:hypothetical protein